MAKKRKQASHESDGKGLRIIAALKLAKGLLLVAVDIGAIKLLHKDLSELATNWITAIRVDPDNRLIHGLITKLGLMDDRKLEELSIGSFFYSALLLTEGAGLWMKKRWASTSRSLPRVRWCRSRSMKSPDASRSPGWHTSHQCGNRLVFVRPVAEGSR